MAHGLPRAAASVGNTLAMVRPPRSRATTTHRRLPERFSNRRRSFPYVAPIGRLDVAAEVAAVDLGDFALAADRHAAHVRRHRLTQLVCQDERALVLDAEIAREREHALALYLIAEDGDGGEVGAQLHLVEGEQRPGGDAEIRLAILAAPAGRAIGAAAVIDRQGTAMRADRLAFRLRPPDLPEHRLGLGIGHPYDLGEIEGTGCRRQKKMPRHGGQSRGCRAGP